MSEEYDEISNFVEYAITQIESQLNDFFYKLNILNDKSQTLTQIISIFEESATEFLDYDYILEKIIDSDINCKDTEIIQKIIIEEIELKFPRFLVYHLVKDSLTLLHKAILLEGFLSPEDFYNISRPTTKPRPIKGAARETAEIHLTRIRFAYYYYNTNSGFDNAIKRTTKYIRQSLFDKSDWAAREDLYLGKFKTFLNTLAVLVNAKLSSDFPES